MSYKARQVSVADALAALASGVVFERRPPARSADDGAGTETVPHSHRPLGVQAPVPRSAAERPSAAPPPAGAADGDLDSARARLGQLLEDAGALEPEQLATALREQARTGGRLGEILAVSGVVSTAALTQAIAHQLGMDTLRPTDEPVALLTPREAHAWRAVALRGAGDGAGEVAVAVADPRRDVLEQLEARLECPVRPRLCDEATLDELIHRVYAHVDADEVTRTLREEAPDLSAYRTAPTRAQTVPATIVGSLLALGAVMNVGLTAMVLVGIGTAFFVLGTGFRLYAARQGCRPGATMDATDEDLAAIDQRELPVYTILLPLYKEKPGTVRTLLNALSQLDYPKHKLDGLALIEDDDDLTSAAIDAVGRPAWLRVLSLPPGVPRTKPRAMCIGLRHAKGTLVTVYDAEDKPDPLQLKKAAWAFARADDSVACLQAKLGYYNPRQNVLTRLFTLEYDAWFNIFLPGAHHIGAPIPLGGTSNHFRRWALESCLGWDPYNVTEDADLGMRFARHGFKTAMLESTTGEEANSRVPSWLRQRSRWIKGYMQTLLVHTRRPRRLAAELGPKATATFLLILGGSVVTALIAPVFWLLLVVWFVFEPSWLAAMFPAPIFYPASISLVLGNFSLLLLSLAAAVSRGHDDLARYALLMPLYWLLMSIAAYMALVELILRPHHWHKTEHGLHLAEEPA